jgi:hypothetical protein
MSAMRKIKRAGAGGWIRRCVCRDGAGSEPSLFSESKMLVAAVT